MAESTRPAIDRREGPRDRRASRIPDLGLIDTARPPRPKGIVKADLQHDYERGTLALHVVTDDGLTHISSIAAMAAPFGTDVRKALMSVRDSMHQMLSDGNYSCSAEFPLWFNKSMGLE